MVLNLVIDEFTDMKLEMKWNRFEISVPIESISCQPFVDVRIIKSYISHEHRIFDNSVVVEIVLVRDGIQELSLFLSSPGPTVSKKNCR